MPKLNKALAKAAAEAEPTHGFGLLPAGKYVARLSGVEAKSTNKGDPMWVAEFSDLRALDTGEKASGRQWWNLNIPLDANDVPADYEKGPEKWAQAQSLSLGRLTAFFDAFGYETGSDTDEMIGEEAVITVGIRTIQGGNRSGEKANEVRDIESLEKYGKESTAATSGDDDY